MYITYNHEKNITNGFLKVCLKEMFMKLISSVLIDMLNIYNYLGSI